MRVLGVDQSMRNCGWQVLDVKSELPPRQITSKMDRVNPDGCIHTHKQFQRLDGGTIKNEEKGVSVLSRLLDTARQIYELTLQYRPDILVLEGALDIGLNRSPTGLALFSLIMQHWHPIGRDNTFYKAAELTVKGGRYSDPTEKDARVKYGIYGEQLGLVLDYQPEFVIAIRPERLNGMVHGKRTATGSEVVKKYKEQAGDPVKRLTEHEADSYFLAYHGVRFVMSCLANQEKEVYWPREILSTKEKNYFLEATKKPGKSRGKVVKLITSQAEIKTGMLYQQQEAWWRNRRDESILDKARKSLLSVSGRGEESQTKEAEDA
jgi:hypothetical protein